MRRVIQLSAFAFVLMALATDGFSQQPPPAPPVAASTVIEFSGKDIGKSGRLGRFMEFSTGKGGGEGGSIMSALPLIMSATGGQGGGGPGGMRMMGGDPNQFFNFLSKGRDVINRNDLGEMERAMFDRMAPRFGITNGQITRQQFQQIADQMRSRGGPGGPGGGGFGGGMAPEQMDRFSDERFRRADQNGDGLLQVNEMSERLRPVWEKFDSNRDGALDLGEFRGYMRSIFQQPSGENQPGQTPEAPPAMVLPQMPSTDSASLDDERKPTVYRAGKLPKEIPGWFEQLDSDKDGQIGLYEWVQGSRVLDEFRGMDRNDDGFLTIDEIMIVVRGTNSNRSNGSSSEWLASGNNSSGGFGGGPGNPMMRFGEFSMSPDNRGRPWGGGRGGPGMRGDGGRGPGGNGNGNRDGGGRGWPAMGGFMPGFGGGPGGGRGRGGDNNGGAWRRDGGASFGPNSPPAGGMPGNGPGPRRGGNRDRDGQDR